MGKQDRKDSPLGLMAGFATSRIAAGMARVFALAAAVALAGCWDEAKVSGQWTIDPATIPSMDVVEVDSGESRRVHVHNNEGGFAFKIDCPGHYAFVARSQPPVVAFLWTERTMTGCKANGADALSSLPESAR